LLAKENAILNLYIPFFIKRNISFYTMSWIHSRVYTRYRSCLDLLVSTLYQTPLILAAFSANFTKSFWKPNIIFLCLLNLPFLSIVGLGSQSQIIICFLYPCCNAITATPYIYQTRLSQLDRTVFSVVVVKHPNYTFFLSFFSVQNSLKVDLLWGSSFLGR
jgi:hypothetical protein